MGKRYIAGKLWGRSATSMGTVIDTLTSMSTSRDHQKLGQLHVVLSYLDDERLSVLVNQRRCAGETLGEGLVWAATVLPRLDRLKADRRRSTASGN